MNPNHLNMNVSPKYQLPMRYVNRPEYLRDSNQFPQYIKNLVIDLEKIWLDEKKLIVESPSKQLLELQSKQKSFMEKLNGLQKQYDNDLRGWKYDLDQERNIREEQSKKFEQELKSKQNDLVATQNQYQQEIAQLNSIIKQKENEINTRISVIQTKDNQINRCNERVQQKDNEINNHNTQIQQKDNEIIKNTALIRQKDDEIERLKLQLSNALKDIEQQEQRLVEAAMVSGVKFTDYETQITSLRSENLLICQVLESMEKKYQSRNIESGEILNPVAQTLCEQSYFGVDNSLNNTQYVNGDDNLRNECAVSQELAQCMMKCIRFTKHHCEVHGWPIEHLCIDSICNHKTRRMCGRCMRKSDSNIAHIDNILECLMNQRLKDQQIKNMRKAQVRQEFQNITHQIMEQLNRISQDIDSLLQQVVGGDIIVEYLINELVSKDSILTFQIEKLAEHIGNVITEGSEDEYKVKTIHIIEDEQPYINCTELIRQHTDILKQLQKVSLSAPSEVQSKGQSEILLSVGC